ncbi:MAG: O-antigen ligase [Verrucomicrobiales bacterium]|jgi:O-antigen ligase
MDLKPDRLNPRTLISLAWSILLAVFAAFWFCAIKDQVLPEASTNWGVAIELTSSESGEARLYWETEAGIAQENSLGRPIESGKRHELFFPLPVGVEIKGFRFDPVDRAETQPTVKIDRAELVGPRGVWLAEKPGIKRIKAQTDIEPGTWEKFPFESKVAGTDPQLRFSLNGAPLAAPEAEFAKAAKTVWWTAFSVFAVVFLCLQFVSRARSIALGIVGVGWVVYLIAHFVIPVRAIDPFWFYHVLFGISLFLCLLSTRELWASFKTLALHPPMWALAAFVVFFGISAVGLTAESQPTQNTVLMNLGFLVLAPVIFLLLRDFCRFEAVGIRFVWIGVAIAVAAFIVFKMYDGSTPFSARLFQYMALSPDGGAEDVFTPLHRTISGTVVFAMSLILGLSWADGRERTCDRADWRWLTIYVVAAAPILLYVLFTQSRGVMLGLLAALCVVALARRARASRMVGAAFVVLFALFFYGLPDKLDKITSRGKHASATAEQKAESKPKETTEGGIKGRSTSGRTDIWKVYFEEIKKKPIFGHGFGAAQTLLVELDPSLFKEGDSHLASTEWNPHSVHLSVLYFGGAVGFLIHGSLLGLILFFALKRHRQTGNGAYLLSAAWLTLAAISVAFESTLIAYDKGGTLLRYPNEYWIFYWGAIIFGIVQTALPDLSSKKPE